jgi:Protein of unknown function (DUF2845)
MKKLILAICCCLLATEQAFALKCGNKIIRIGDRMHRVQRLCGDPVFTDAYDRPFLQYGYLYGATHIDIWTYNFGSSRFMQELVFENGVLRYINQLDYGY